MIDSVNFADEKREGEREESQSHISVHHSHTPQQFTSCCCLEKMVVNLQCQNADIS